MSFSKADRDRDFGRTIIEAFGYIERYLDGMTIEDFRVDSKTQDAVTMRLQQILESAAKISDQAKKNLKIDWASLTAMRNKISHSYVDVDPEIVWQLIKELEEFKAVIAWVRKSI